MTRSIELGCLVAFGVCAVMVSPWWLAGVAITIVYILRLEVASICHQADNAAAAVPADNASRDGDDVTRDRECNRA